MILVAASHGPWYNWLTPAVAVSILAPLLALVGVILTVWRSGVNAINAENARAQSAIHAENVRASNAIAAEDRRAAAAIEAEDRRHAHDLELDLARRLRDDQRVAYERLAGALTSVASPLGYFAMGVEGTTLGNYGERQLELLEAAVRAIDDALEGHALYIPTDIRLSAGLVSSDAFMVQVYAGNLRDDEGGLEKRREYARKARNLSVEVMTTLRAGVGLSDKRVDK
ncbi:hypothetical protein GCM10023221_17870 [Luteimicrobium xylanilyticum]|uniref:hypothetical protein n=1 Tax=Luteimicrobium xylanilyticum TaxID=1133546 RepID=UPI000688C654|nr:hypothetical protein [Luteimicrobium xylanilyticum]